MGARMEAAARTAMETAASRADMLRAMRTWPIVFLAAAFFGLCASAAAQDKHKDKGRPPEGHGAAHRVHRLHQNPDEYIKAMEDPERLTWQKPDELLKALGIRPGMRVADLGAGPGFMTRRLARLVQPQGWVYAIDVEPFMLKALHARLREDRLSNVTTLLAAEDDPLLPPGSVDLVLIVDVYHHLKDRPAYLGRLARALRPGGRIAIVDFHKRDLPVGPPPEMKLSPAEVGAEAQKAGLRPLLAPPENLLPYQYVLVFSPAPGP